MVMTERHLSTALQETPMALIEPTQKVVAAASQKMEEVNAAYVDKTTIFDAVFVNQDTHRMYRIMRSSGLIHERGKSPAGFSIDGIQLDEDGHAVDRLEDVDVPETQEQVTAENIIHLRGVNPVAMVQLGIELGTATQVDEDTYWQAEKSLNRREIDRMTTDFLHEHLSSNTREALRKDIESKLPY